MRSIGVWRLLALLSLLLWCVALFAPISAIPVAGTRGPLRPDEFHGLNVGWTVAVYGWLGPLGLAPGWYANIPLAISLCRGLRNRPPGRWSVLIGIVLAATAFAPFRFEDWKLGHAWYVLRGPALWLWLGACVLTWLPAGSDERLKERMPSH